MYSITKILKQEIVLKLLNHWKMKFLTFLFEINTYSFEYIFKKNYDTRNIPYL